MNSQYFIAPIGHEVIICDNGQPLKRGKLGIFSKIGNMFYHASYTIAHNCGSKTVIPFIGEREALMEILKNMAKNVPLIPFHWRVDREPVYYHTQRGLTTEILP